MNRRKLFKTGLALAGGSVIASVASAQKTEQENNKSSQNTLAETLSGRRKLGTLEVSSVGLGVCRICGVLIKQQYRPGLKC